MVPKRQPMQAGLLGPRVTSVENSSIKHGVSLLQEGVNFNLGTRWRDTGYKSRRTMRVTWRNGWTTVSPVSQQRPLLTQLHRTPKVPNVVRVRMSGLGKATSGTRPGTTSSQRSGSPSVIYMGIVERRAICDAILRTAPHQR